MRRDPGQEIQLGGIAMENVEGGLGRRGVGGRRAGGDQIELVARHVGNHQGRQPPGAARPGEPAPFDPAELLPHNVEFLDGGPGGAEATGQDNLLLQRNAVRRRQQRRTAAGKQAEAQVSRSQGLDQPQDFLRRGDAGRSRLIHAGWPDGPQGDASQGTNAIGRDVHDAGELLFLAESRSEGVLNGGGHARPRLARPDNDDAADAFQRKSFLADRQFPPFDADRPGDEPA